jgi:hypothetical protein
MFGRSSRASVPVVPEGPHLDLSGPRLRRAFATLVQGAEAHGGVERYVDALKLKQTLFREALLSQDGQRALQIEAAAFMPLCAFLPTVRRRIVPWFAEPLFSGLRSAIAALLEPTDDTSGTDARIRAFCAGFPQDDAHRWTRDLAAELLHNCDPERYPLMTRWVWDAGTNTGVLREIWHGPDVDHVTIAARDDHATFLVLRAELSQFLSGNGVFRDVLQFVDMLCAQVYAGYIGEQGSSYLRTDFTAPEDPMLHARRLLGLDGIRPGTGRLRIKTIDGEALSVADPSSPPVSG